MDLYLISIGSIPLYNGYSGSSLQETLFYNVECSGTEDSIFDCRKNGGGADGCQQYQDAAVICQGEEIDVLHTNVCMCLVWCMQYILSLKLISQTY